MAFKLSSRSLGRLDGVDEKLSNIVKKAIGYTTVDLMAYLNGRGCWEINVYDEIADAMKRAAIEEGVPVRWGAAWTVSDIRTWGGTMEEAMLHYVDIRRGQNKRPFIDGPHFELMQSINGDI